MSDELRDQQQRSASLDEAFRAQIDSRLKELHTMLPGLIESFDPDTQTARVQPCIKRIWFEHGAVDLPVCVDVPVWFPGGGDWFLTFPVKKGDECVLGFFERAIDNWFAQGGLQSPSEYRLHDLSDGVALVGLNSQPRKIDAFQGDALELRTRDRATRVTMKADGTIENVNPAGGTKLTSEGQFVINAPGGILLQGNTTIVGALAATPGTAPGTSGVTMTGPVAVTGNITATGGVTATGEVVGNGKSLSSHKHGGVQTGSGHTAAPD